jgi:hypothetical protein
MRQRVSFAMLNSNYGLICIELTKWGLKTIQNFILHQKKPQAHLNLGLI